MVIALWIVNGVLAAVFLAVGLNKALRSKQALQTNAAMAWTEDFPPAAIRLVGVLEILGALGLILPLATGIAPLLTPVAAVGLVVVMAGAVVTHLRRRETPLPPLILGLLAVVSAALGFLVVL